MRSERVTRPARVERAEAPGVSARRRPAPMPVVWPLLLLLAAPGITWAQALDFGRNPAPAFELGSYGAGESPAHALGFSVFRGELEVYRAAVTYPLGFRFNGFDALGPAGTEIGGLMLDFDGDGIADHQVPLRSLTSHLAYADVIPDGRFSPQLEPTLGHGSDTFVLHLPFGGDANRDTVVARADARVILVLFAGLITSPHEAGPHVITAELTSVDPDTDGADDGRGAPPLALAFEVSVPIEAAALVPFAVFCIDTAQVRPVHPAPPGRGDRARAEGNGHRYDEFRIHGRLRFGSGSDGVDLSRESVIVTFGGFQQDVPGTAFSAVGNAFARFTHPGPGITRFELGPGGLFRVEARGLGLDAPDGHRPVPFALQIGDDRGEALLMFDRHGHVRPDHPCPP